jgi:hypothetical protein
LSRATGPSASTRFRLSGSPQVPPVASPRTVPQGLTPGAARGRHANLRVRFRQGLVVVKFADERRALAFERYLKSGSGCPFAQRHLR